MDNYKLRVFKNSINKTDKTQLLSLLQDNFKKSKEYFEWKHCFDGYNSIEKYTYCFFDEEKCIATLLAIVGNFHFSNQDLRYALIADGATHKNYRRKGLFENLLKIVLSDLPNKKVEFILGFGNEISRQTLIKKLNYKDFAGMFNARYKVRYKYPILNVVSLAKNIIINLIPKSRKLQITNIDSNSYLDYYRKLIFQFDFYFYHNLNGFLWRGNKPGTNYKYKALFDENSELIAISIINYLEDHLYIEDFVFKQGKELYARHLIRYIQKEAFGLAGINRILFSHNLNDSLQNVFKKEGFKIKTNSNHVLFKLITGSNIKLNEVDTNDLHFAKIHKNE